VEKKWTMEDVEACDLFYKTHGIGFSSFPFPKDLFTKFVKENDGYFPGMLKFLCIFLLTLRIVKIEALPEGSVVHAHTPVYQMTTEGEYARLCTFLETILTHVWYPSSVATLSRMIKGK
jgi:hypothetical protein